jgi:hypothetical protein
VVLFGCETAREDQPVLAAPSTLVYMIADNNLDYYAMANIRQMEKGLPTEATGSLYVFIDRSVGGNPSHPCLFRITQNTDDTTVISPIIQVYREQNTSNPAFLRQVIADVKTYCAAEHSELRRLVLWSHGTGWLPKGTPFDEPDDEKTQSILFSFGLDNTATVHKEMDVKELAAALNGEHFEFLLMDACFMGAIEVAYEMRDVCDYLIVSPSEIVSSGFPYKDITESLLSMEVQPVEIARVFFTHYNNQTAPTLQSATISVVETKYLHDFALSMRAVYADYVLYKSDIVIDALAQYDRTSSHYFFDVKNFIFYVSKQSHNDYKELALLYDKMVQYYQHTPKMFATLDLSATTGLHLYIPNNYETREDLHDYYQKLLWTQESHAVLLFN